GLGLHLRHWHPTCPSVPTSPAVQPSKAHLTHVGALSGRATRTRIRRVIRRWLRGHAAAFPWPFGLSAFASWVILLPVRNWGFLTVHLPEGSVLLGLRGLPRSAPGSHDWGGRPLLLRDQRCPHPARLTAGVAWRLSAPGPWLPPALPSSSLPITKLSTGFTCVRPSSLPLACCPLDDQGTLGLER